MSLLIPLNILYDTVKRVFLFAHVWLCRRYIPRLLDCFPHARSAMEHAHLIIPIWDMQPRNIGIHRRHTPIRDRQMKHARPICKAIAILGCGPILMTYFTGFNHNFWDRGKGLHRLLLDKIVSCYVPRSIHFWGCIGNSHCRILNQLHMYLFLDTKRLSFSWNQSLKLTVMLKIPTWRHLCWPLVIPILNSPKFMQFGTGWKSALIWGFPAQLPSL